MDQKLGIISISISFGLSMLMIFLRRADWFTTKLKNIIIYIFSIVGLIGFVFSDSNNFRYFFYSFLVPPIMLLVERLFKSLSFKLHKRNFYLYLSTNVDWEWIVGENDKIRPTDIIFSFSLLIINMGLVFLGSVLI
jgi:hypothetical protein